MTTGASTGSASQSELQPQEIAILGGYGLLGRDLARRLLEQSGARVIIVGRRDEPAAKLAGALAAEHGADRVEARRADAAKAEEVAAAVRGAQWLVIAVDGAQHLDSIIEGALAAEVDCVDLLTDPGRTEIWSAYRDRVVAAGRVAVTEAGVQPGLPGVLLRALESEQPRVDLADAATALRLKVPKDLPMPKSMVGLTATFATMPKTYAFGHPTPSFAALLFPYRYHWFRAPFRRQTVAIMPLPEVGAFAARHPKARRVRYMVGGLDDFATWVVLPLIYPFLLLFGRRARAFFARLVYYGALRPFSRPPHGVAVRAEVKAPGPNGKRTSLEVQHDGEYELTADVVVALTQNLAAERPTPGVHFMADVVDPELFLRDLESMGARVDRSG